MGMGMGAAVVPPRAAGLRKYKALVTWRFRPGSVSKPVKHPAAATPVLVAKVCGSGVTPGGGGEPQSKRVTRSASAKKSLDAKDGGRLGPGHGGDVAMSGICGVAEASGLKGTGNSCCAGVGVAAGEDCKSNFSASARDTDGKVIGRAGGGGPADDTAACNPEGAGRNTGVKKECAFLLFLVVMLNMYISIFLVMPAI